MTLESCSALTFTRWGCSSLLSAGMPWHWLIRLWASVPAEHFLYLPSFCSSSQLHRALSGRTSMSGPEARGFEHHSLGLACCQHPGWFRCHSQPFDRRRLIRACFSLSQAAAFKPRGSVFLFSPALLVQPRLMGTWSVRPFHVADNEVDGSFKHLLPEALQTAPIQATLSEVLSDFCFDT